MVVGASATACQLPTRWYTVDSTADEVDAAPGDGACSTAGGTCTLRAAIGEANALHEVSDITLADDATYVLSRAGSGDDEGDLDVLVSVTIHGNGSTIDAARIDRVVQTTGADVRLTVEDLTITGGDTPGEGGGVAGTVTAVRSTIAGNRAAGGTECIWLTDSGEPPSAPPARCTYNGRGGGGVAGDLLAFDSTISGNASVNPNVGCVQQTVNLPPVVHLLACTFSGGGGVSGTADLVGSTISGNTATNGHGHEVMGTAHLIRSTVVDHNTAGTTMAGAVTHAGTLWQVAGASPCAAAVPSNAPVDGNGTFTSLGYNVSIAAGCGMTQPSDRPGATVTLGALGANGGPTNTHLPAAGTVGLDHIPVGTTVLCDTDHDQRGLPRPSGPGCDVGAVERQPSDT